MSSDSNVPVQGGGANLLKQDLECGQSGGDLVQVRAAQFARHGSWIGPHHGAWKLDSGRSREGHFVRSWTGTSSGLLAGVLLEDEDEDGPKPGGMKNC
jgi:hypothetical protein